MSSGSVPPQPNEPPKPVPKSEMREDSITAFDRTGTDNSRAFLITVIVMVIIGLAGIMLFTGD